MAKLVTAIFNARSSAMLANEDLMRHGFAQEDISLLLTDTTFGREFFTDLSNKAPEVGVGGTIAGAIIGGIVTGLMSHGYIADAGTGIAALSMPFAILTGMAMGGTVGLLVGALLGAAMPEYEFNLYRTDKHKGGIVVGVYCHVKREAEVRNLLEAAGGHEIRTKSVANEALPVRTSEYLPASDRPLDV